MAKGPCNEPCVGKRTMPVVNCENLKHQGCGWVVTDFVKQKKFHNTLNTEITDYPVTFPSSSGKIFKMCH